MLKLIASSSSDSWSARNWRVMSQIAARHTAGSSDLMNLAKKDIELAVSLGRDVGATVPLGELISQDVANLFADD